MICPNVSCGRDLPVIGLVKLTDFRYRRFLFWSWLSAPHAGNVVRCASCGHTYAIGPKGIFKPLGVPEPATATNGGEPAPHGMSAEEKARKAQAMRQRGPMLPREAPPV